MRLLDRSYSPHSGAGINQKIKGKEKKKGHDV
jgi:hypothetical protein